MIERFLVHPISNLAASGQLSLGDSLTADLDVDRKSLMFTKAVQVIDADAMAALTGKRKDTAGANGTLRRARDAFTEAKATYDQKFSELLKILEAGGKL